jgi:hypothetical protein
MYYGGRVGDGERGKAVEAIITNSESLSTLRTVFRRNSGKESKTVKF